MRPSLFTLIAGLIALTEALPIRTSSLTASHLVKRADPNFGISSDGKTHLAKRDDLQYMAPKSDWDYSNKTAGNQEVDIDATFTSLDACKYGCVVRPNCGGFVWDKSAGKCWLKQNIGMGRGVSLAGVDFYCRILKDSLCAKDMPGSSITNATTSGSNSTAANGTTTTNSTTNSTLTNGTTTNVTATANSTSTNGTTTANGTTLINSTCTRMLKSVNRNNPIVTDDESIGCIRQGKYELVLNQDGSLSISNLETGVKSWRSPASANGLMDLPFVCAVGNGKFACSSGDESTEYWSTKTSMNDGYGGFNSTNLRVKITDDGKLDASF
jgi:hypothetical protein